MKFFFQYLVSDNSRETSNIPIINAHENSDSNKDIHILPWTRILSPKFLYENKSVIVSIAKNLFQ